jgi:two-component system, sensor histidine kinase YesM
MKGSPVLWFSKTSEAKYKRRLFRNYLAVAVIPASVFFIFGTVSFLLSLNYMFHEISVINRASLEESRNAVENVLKESDAVILGMSTDPIFFSQADRLLGSPLQTLEDVRLRASVLGTLKSAVNVHPYIQSIYVYIPHPSNLIATSSDDVVPISMFPDTKWIEIGEERRQELSSHIEARTVEPYPGISLQFNYLTIFRNILSSAGFVNKGLIALNLNMEYLETLMASHLSSGLGLVMLLDSSGSVLAKAGNDESEVSKGSHLVYEIPLKGYPFSLRTIIPKMVYYRLPITLGIISILSTLSALVIGLGIAYGLSRRSFHNIAEIVDIIHAAECGEPLPSPKVSPKNGYHDLIYSILKSFMEQRYLQLQLSERGLQAKTLELLALQHQMNPHFLFNTLTSISCKALALTGGYNSVTEMIEHLAQILHYAQGSDGQPVSIEEELIYIEHYIDILSSRYKDDFTVEWHVEEIVRAARCIKLLFQPLIENAIYHGIREAEGKRCIVVEARLVDEDVLVSVEDNGVGMNAMRLAEVRNRIKSMEHLDYHIGLYNTARRLYLQYGEAAEVKIESEEGRGTKVTLRFPFLEVSVR